MTVSLDKFDKLNIVKLSGELGYPELCSVSNVFVNIAGSKTNIIIIDMHGLNFISSVIIREIVRAWQKLNNQGTKVLFIGLNKDIFEIFKLTGLTSLFNIEDITLEEAQQRLSTGK